MRAYCCCLLGVFAAACAPSGTTSPSTWSALAVATAPAGTAGDASLNRLVIATRGEEIVQVDPSTGAHRTISTLESRGTVKSLDLSDQTLLVGSANNAVSAIDLGSGKALWDVSLGKYDESRLADPTVIVRDSVAYADGECGVMAVDLTTHKVMWQNAVGDAGDCTRHPGGFAVSGDRVFVGGGGATALGESSLFALDRATGQLAWTKPLDTTGIGTMKLAGNTLLVPAGDLLALDAATGEIKWKLATDHTAPGVGMPIIAGDKVLVQGPADTSSGRLFCVGLASGEVIWTADAGNQNAGFYAPTVAGNVVFGVVGNGRPFAADLATGTLVWAKDDVSVSSSPVFANGRLFASGGNVSGGGTTEHDVGLLSLDASSGALLWLDDDFASGTALSPVVVADNGVFRAGADAR
jgi:outer membrane protein assembly factor BamB